MIRTSGNFTNDIIINNTHINRIYNNGEIYWGNEPTSTPPTPTHLIHGTSRYSSNFNIKLNGQNVEVTVDSNTGEFWLDSWSGTLTNLSNCFDNLQNILTIDQFNLDTSQVTSFENYVNRCYNLLFVDTSNLNTSNAKHLGGMFAQCHELTSLDLSNFDTSNVTTIQYIFYYSEHIVTLNLNNWDLSRCASYNVWAFQDCASLTDVYINVEATLMKLTNNLSAQGNSYIPSSATIHYNDVDYKWQNNAWTPQN